MSSPPDSRDDHALHRALLDELPIGLWVARAPGGELAYANLRFAEILGMPPRSDVAAGAYTHAYRIVDRSGRPYPEQRLPFVQALQQRRTVVVDDLAIERPDGKRAFIRAFGKPLWGDRGVITHVLVAFLDMSAEVNAVREREQARAHLDTALHHAPIILFSADLDGTITVSEGAALAGLGAKSGELVGKNVFEMFAHDAQVIANIKRALSGESFTAISHHGSTALESWLGPLRDEDGVVDGYIGVSTDVTERLRLERQMTHADRMTVLGRLAASVAHEINNPLTYAMEALRLVTNAVEHGSANKAPSNDLRVLLANAAEGLERVRLITRDLKAFSHPDEDKRGPVQLDAAVQAATRLVLGREDLRAQLKLSLASDATVNADENRLVQVFSNLLLNAADAMPAGDESDLAHNVIRVSSRSEGERAFVEVADSGPGIPLALREQVFEPFFTTKPVGEGTGLGLHMTRTLIHALGGSVTVGDAPEGGALFTVALPRLAKSAYAASASAAARPSAPPPKPPQARPRVLIIDDEPMITRVFRASLEDTCDVEVALSGRAALECLAKGTAYDFVFCDLMMADIGGAQLYAELKRVAPGRERELIFMTGGVYDPAVGQFLAGVSNRCLDKPFDIRRAVLGDRA